MDDLKKMISAVINGQSAMKGELVKKIEGVEKKLGGEIEKSGKNLGVRIGKLENRVHRGFITVNTRLARLGKQIAYLEDDTPTREEFDELKERVGQYHSIS